MTRHVATIFLRTLFRALPLDDIPDLIPKLSHAELSSSVMFDELERFHLVETPDADGGLATKPLESAEDFLHWMQQRVEGEMLANGDARLDAFRTFLGQREQECGECKFRYSSHCRNNANFV